MIESNFEWTDELVNKLIDLRNEPENVASYQRINLCKKGASLPFWLKITNALGLSPNLVHSVKEKYRLVRRKNWDIYLRYKKTGKVHSRSKYIEKFISIFENEQSQKSITSKAKQDSNLVLSPSASPIDLQSNQNSKEIAGDDEHDDGSQNKINAIPDLKSSVFGDLNAKANLQSQGSLENFEEVAKKESQISELGHSSEKLKRNKRPLDDKWKELIEKCQDTVNIRQEYYKIKSENLKAVSCYTKYCKKTLKKMKKMELDMNQFFSAMAAEMQKTNKLLLFLMKKIDELEKSK